MVSKSYFSALLIPTFYCLGFSLFVYPADQLIRGELVLEHEAKHPHFATFVVLTYSVTTCAFLYLRELELPFMSSLGFVTLDHVFKTVMILAIVMSVFKNLIGSDPLTLVVSCFSSMFKSKPKKATRESKKAEAKVSDDEEEEESVQVESPKKVRTTRRRISRP
ncbi:hypothetical protein RF11_00835 [Thelohanellus kitauei]|uniref:Uncharacterized protein n=1 Tax=Thelohanellus kitauei TaxID=669202 RepID=A0A0C2IFH9_THEKT|nr:hypothetical protein RF11_00835 [Thelohanellus kitauei]